MSTVLDAPIGQDAVAGSGPGNPWVRFLARRFLRFAVSLWLLITASWAILHAIPGDPVRAALGVTAPEALVQQERAELGLDQPILQQYWRYIQHTIQGDLGSSIQFHLPVSQVISSRLPVTLEIVVLTFAVVMLFSVPVGMAAGVLTRGGGHPRFEVAFSAVTGVFAAIPQFLLAVLLVEALAVEMHLLPTSGRLGPTSYILPIFCLAVGPAMLIARVVRVEMIKVLNEDYMRTARAKRLPGHLLYARHALPNLLTPTLTLSGLTLSGLVAGTVLVETVFAWPGMGTAMVQSIVQKDYPLAQGFLLVYGTAVLLINLVVDVLIAVVDPRSTLKDV